MRQLFILLSSFALLITLSGCTTDLIDTSQTNTESIEEASLAEEQIALQDLITEEPLIVEQSDTWGSADALVDSEYTIYEMLVYAIQDEYTARSEYVYIQSTFDVTKPFSNIMSSEETHISLLIPLFETYGYTVPEDSSNDHLFVMNSLEDAFAIGVEAEINNIAMYNAFLNEDLPSDIYDVFVKLRDASLNHLSAFERNLARY